MREDWDDEDRAYGRYLDQKAEDAYFEREPAPYVHPPWHRDVDGKVLAQFRSATFGFNGEFSDAE